MRKSARIQFRAYAIAALALAVVLTLASEGWSRARPPAGCQQMTEAVAKALFAEWNKALQQKPETVVRTYTPNAVLLPTVQNGPLIGRAAIRGYFDHFLEQHPVGRIDTRAIIPVGCNTGVVAGLYTFTVDDGTARVDKPARYTFVYVYETAARRWLIAQHHSSAQPQQSATK